MKMHAFLSALLVLAPPLAGWAQAAGEATAVAAPGAPAGAADAAGATGQRSALWLAVDAQDRQADAPVPLRRLTPEQRLELREQVRRAWERMETGQVPPPVATSAAQQ